MRNCGNHQRESLLKCGCADVRMALSCHTIAPTGYCCLLPGALASTQQITAVVFVLWFASRLTSPRGGDFKCLEAPVRFLSRLWSEESGQDVAEYAVMLAVILVIVVGTIRLIGGNANNVFSSVASSITQ